LGEVLEPDVEELGRAIHDAYADALSRVSRNPLGGRGACFEQVIRQFTFPGSGGMEPSLPDGGRARAHPGPDAAASEALTVKKA
jgi:hypothetical protein